MPPLGMRSVGVTNVPFGQVLIDFSEELEQGLFLNCVDHSLKRSLEVLIHHQRNRKQNSFLEGLPLATSPFVDATSVHSVRSSPIEYLGQHRRMS